ncbi:MAG TPA: glycosyltransferase [Blastocatellia bacterium]|jgi:cellulose synthase/poly-beta-1,6-N-acetylglucosamine synthase-like glycosyltransferase|nr:glycosyltransferase [Blastocatellia bacterium]
MDRFFSIFGFLLFIQSVLALIATMRFTRYALRRRPARQTRYQPKAVVIVPCRGLEHGFEENIHAILTQDYRDYEVVFVTESENDPAHGVLARLLKQRRRLAPPTWMVVAGEAKNRGQKVHNLLAALDTLNSIGRVEALVFADSDMRPARNWLTELVAPLGDHRVGATTGYRWYLPANEERNLAQCFASTLLSVWNASALALLGERSRFAWGGSMAIRRENFDEIGMKERWQGALSDDYVLTSAVHEHRQRITFVPQCLVASRSEATIKEMFEFTTRQMRITRVYSPRVWRLACVSHGLFNLVFWGGLLWLVISSLTRTPSRSLEFLLAGVFLLGAVTGAMRAVVAARLLGAGHVRKWWAYLSLGPVVSLIYLYNIIASAKTTRIVWRGIGYNLISPSETVILHRPAQRGQTGKVSKSRKRQSSAPSSSQKR